MVRKKIEEKRSTVLTTKTVDVKTVKSYSMYETHKEAREVREQAEYEKIQNEHIRCCEISRMSENIRERIIATFRAEIESHKYLGGDYSQIRSICDELRMRKEAMDKSIKTLQQDYES